MLGERQTDGMKELSGYSSCVRLEQVTGSPCIGAPNTQACAPGIPAMGRHLRKEATT
jgi:hypothetical protein